VKRVVRIEVILLAALFPALLMSCGDGDDPMGPAGDTGTVQIGQTPDALAGAGWSLTGPREADGSGEVTLQALPVGQYTLTWEAVSGYVTPANDTQTLTADGRITFNGLYVEESGDTGTIVVAQTPDVLAGAGWTLTGPQTETCSGDTTLVDMPAGRYTLIWDVVPGHVNPAHDTQTLAADGTITFNGTYLEEPQDTGTI